MHVYCTCMFIWYETAQSDEKISSCCFFLFQPVYTLRLQVLNNTVVMDGVHTWSCEVGYAFTSVYLFPSLIAILFIMKTTRNGLMPTKPNPIQPSPA